MRMSGAYDAASLLLPEVIAHHGRWRAAHAALVCGEQRRSWAQFDAATNRIANGLAALGLAPGARLAVLMANSLEMVELMFGAGKAGVSVVPLNVSVSDAAVAAMLVDSGATAIAASGEHCERIDAILAAGAGGGPGEGILPRLGVDAPAGRGWLDLQAWRDAQPATAPAVRPVAGDECNIIYSSGTTGLRKGIVHTHGCRLNWATDLGLALRYHSGAVTVCSVGLYSNIMWASMLATLLVGGTIVVLPAFSPAALLDAIERHRVTHGAFVPVQLQRLLEADRVGRDLGSLETLMCCGSPLPLPLKRAIPGALGCDLIELYGLTEGLITTLDPEDYARKLESVGRPIPGQRLEIVGDDDQPVPPGQPGEIVGLGRLTMQGYHDRPDATAEATWIDPSGRRWLRTGDIGRLDDEGFLYLVDRKKDMILSGGQNVYPADLEAVLAGHADVAEAAVIGIPDERWGETPLALVVPRPGSPLHAGAPERTEALRQWANERLGRQQRISALRLVESLPRNPNGKILKRELRKAFIP
jgi:acyl-CoA synthetase (AMP-forming)/AMP-acid ligase II